MAPRWTGHVDTYVIDRLPPPETQPRFLFDLPDVQYLETLNAAEALLDGANAAGWRERIAISGRETWTYAALLEAANRMANALVEDFALAPGNRVLLRAPNSAWLSTLWLAVVKAGGIVAPTMPMLRAADIAPVIEKGAFDLAIVDDALMEDLQEAGAQARPSMRIVARSAFDAAAAAKSAAFANVRTHRDDPCLLAFTSGTTGKPKACVHFHRDILAMADTFARHILAPQPSDLYLATPPLAFTFGLGGSLVFPMRFGAAATFPERPGVEALVEHIAAHKVNVLFTAPTSYRQIMARKDARALASLRQCVSAGEALDKTTSDAWFAHTGLRLIDGIGATEMIHIFISAREPDIRPGATGKPVPGYEAALLDEANAELNGEATGRLAVRGPTGCRYLDDERQMNYVIGGWNVTGDVYRRDADGYYWFVSRADDMIISSGYNIAAIDVESALLAHAAVAECAVVAAPDAERGFVPKAFVVLKSPAADPGALICELQDFVKRTIAPYKYPRVIEFVPELPKTPTGKIQRHKLRAG